MAETLRSIRIIIEVETNKRSIREVVTEPDDVEDAVNRVTDLIDHIKENG